MSSELVRTPVTLFSLSFSGDFVVTKKRLRPELSVSSSSKAWQRGPRLEHHAIERHAARAAFLAEHERCRLADTVDIIQAEELRLARIDEKDFAVVTAGADHDRQRVDDLHEPLG